MRCGGCGAKVGATVLSRFRLPEEHVAELLRAARAVIANEGTDAQGRQRTFKFHRGRPALDVATLFSLLPCAEGGVAVTGDVAKLEASKKKGDRRALQEHLARIAGLRDAFADVAAFLEALLSPGWKLCRSDGSPFAHHNGLQVMAKHPTGSSAGSEEDWRGHIDQREGGKRKDPRSRSAVHSQGKGTRPQQNFTLLLGVLLEGDENATRDDAGNLQVAKGSHLVLSERFREIVRGKCPGQGSSPAEDRTVQYRYNPARGE